MGYQEIMREYANQRARCAGKSVDELLALANGNEIKFIQALEMAVQQKSERAGEDGMSEEEVIVLAVEALEREVNNGGYSQFFVNSSREFTPIIVHALLRIGCPETAEITKRAIAAAGFQGLAPIALAGALEAYGKEYGRENAHRFINPKEAQAIVDGIVSDDSSSVPDRGKPNSVSSKAWDALEKDLDECDQLYYRAGENIGGQLIDFVKANKNAIQP
jgi:hypothetical protein